MFKELLVVAVFVGLASAKVISKSDNGMKKRDLFEPAARSLPRHILEDAELGDHSIFDEKRGADFDKALQMYDYVTEMNKRKACTHFFPRLCPVLGKNGYCKRRKGRRALFVAKFCGWVCNRC